MKKTITASILFIISIISGYSQVNYSQEFGKVTQYEMSMSQYEQDKDAEAVVIYDLGDYYFRPDETRGFLLSMERKVKIKILKQAGTKYANFEIPYYSENREWESIEKIEAITYNMEGGQLTKTILDPKNIYEEKVSNNLSIKKVALADVREGSVIEYKYLITTPYFFNMRKWDFQKKIPVVYSKLKYKAIPYYEYTYILRSINKFDEYKATPLNDEIRFGHLVYKEMQYEFGLKNLPAFKDEEYITSEQDYLISLYFQLSKIYYPRGGSKEIMTTWPAMCDDFLKDNDFGKYIKNSEKEGKKILPTLDIASKTPLEQVETITKYVKEKYNWNGNYGKLSEYSVSDFIKKQTGNVANINLFLTGLLRSAGLEAYPIILSTRKNGSISLSHPFQQFFNYTIVLVRIGEKIYYLDATEPLLYYSDLPERCLNVNGLVVKPKSEEWVSIRQKELSISQKNFILDIIPEESKMNVKARFAGRGQKAYNYRSTYLGKTENLQKELKSNNNIDVKGDINIDENDDLDKPFVFSFAFDASVENLSDKLFIHPFCNLSISDNPFKQTKRTLPVDMIYMQSDFYRSEINIPEGYKINYLPSPYIVDDNLVSIQYTVQKNNNKIIINAGYTLKQNIYQPQNYISLKMSFAEAIKRFSEMVILEKE